VLFEVIKNMNPITPTIFHDARSRVNPQLVHSHQQAVLPPCRERLAAPHSHIAARLRRVTFPFWSLSYRSTFVENVALVLGMVGAALVATGKFMGAL
jgi:hypothetical protein